MTDTNKRENTSICRRKFIVGLASIGVAVPVLMSHPSVQKAAAQSGIDIAAAQKEGSITLYTAIDPTIVQNLANEFYKLHKIRINVQRASSAALAQRFTAEEKSNNHLADVYFSTDRAFHDEAGVNGWFAKITDFPGLGGWPKEAWDGVSLAVGYNPYSLIWNKRLVPDGLKSWEELADPRWKGRVMLTDPRSSVTSNQFYKLLRQLYGDDFLRKLGANAIYSPSAVPGIQQVAASAQAIYAPGIHQVVVGLVEKGAPIDESFPEPTISSHNLVSVVSSAPHPNAARLFMSYVVTPEAQAIINKDGFSPLSGVPGTRPMPKVVDIDPEQATKEMPEILKLLGL